MELVAGGTCTSNGTAVSMLYDILSLSRMRLLPLDVTTVTGSRERKGTFVTVDVCTRPFLLIVAPVTGSLESLQLFFLFFLCLTRILRLRPVLPLDEALGVELTDTGRGARQSREAQGGTQQLHHRCDALCTRDLRRAR